MRRINQRKNIFKILYFHQFLRRSCIFKYIFPFEMTQNENIYGPNSYEVKQSECNEFTVLVLICIILLYRLQCYTGAKIWKSSFHSRKTLFLFVHYGSLMFENALCIVLLLSVTIILCVTVVNMSNIVNFLCMILCILV